ncbi:MAG: (d)CMP kinase [Rhodothermaceae bacterium]|nr:(d)CMP kinase [Rhodothermaceae bacterium]MXX58322.1 (d)CMP kinase [Rhodothermaceae bacterium]MYD18239.1 (d)CMP kinase [Rhodothermaceae bacterium]MYD57749.1 (d)CMP kinase [Rhodothermaceae bacterium]MYI43389.1 (d)CMP kinase [Rhodothermaceae bacterium]
MIIAIDGPAASGKSSTARGVAAAAGFVYMDSGLIYRAVALGFLKTGLQSTEDDAEISLRRFQVEVTCVERHMHVHIDGVDVTAELHTPQITEMASQVAALKIVRKRLFGLQRGFGDRYGADPGIVVVGRDMGTIVFPHADLKFFITASLEVRAQRRLIELHQVGEASSFESVLGAIAARDRQDSERKIAPLKKALDAVLIETDKLTLADQIDMILGHVLEQSNSM